MEKSGTFDPHDPYTVLSLLPELQYLGVFRDLFGGLSEVEGGELVARRDIPVIYNHCWTVTRKWYARGYANRRHLSPTQVLNVKIPK